MTATQQHLLAPRAMQDAQHDEALTIEDVEDAVEILWLDDYVHDNFVSELSKPRQILQPCDRNCDAFANIAGRSGLRPMRYS